LMLKCDIILDDISWRKALIGSSQPITAAPGDDVLLPCRVDPEWDAVGRTVEWSRPDLRVPGRQRRVETSLSEAALKRGDVSLTIRNVSLEDGGRFRCFIPSLRRDAEVLLVVGEFISCRMMRMKSFSYFFLSLLLKLSRTELLESLLLFHCGLNWSH
uniref:Ig-like domain-containing protein n=1 Tax=Fundulus heteroclitus TaxID=8078 RepID=A0A3Q2PLY6_FUNHE